MRRRTRPMMPAGRRIASKDKFAAGVDPPREKKQRAKVERLSKAPLSGHGRGLCEALPRRSKMRGAGHPSPPMSWRRYRNSGSLCPRSAPRDARARPVRRRCAAFAGRGARRKRPSALRRAIEVPRLVSGYRTIDANVWRAESPSAPAQRRHRPAPITSHPMTLPTLARG